MKIAESSGEIAIAAKKDSSAMMGIALLTMIFLPATFTAVRSTSLSPSPSVSRSIMASGDSYTLTDPPPQSLFAMPLFQWDAPESNEILSPRFWVFWAVTLPVMAVVICVHFAWIWRVEVIEFMRKQMGSGKKRKHG